MRTAIFLVIASALLLPLQATAQSGGVSGSGTGSAGVTTGTAGGGTAGSSSTMGSAGGTGSMPGPPGTNSLGTAQSSGSGVTTGSAFGSTAIDQRIQDENRQIDQKLKGICRGC
jgi:hypothetical protein